MKIYLLAPNYCWHTKDLVKLSAYNNKLQYVFVADTPHLYQEQFLKGTLAF